MSIAKDNLIDLFEVSSSKRKAAEATRLRAGELSRRERIAGVRSLGTARTVPKGELVFKEGEKAEFFYKVVSGVVRTYTILDDGRRIIDDFHFAGDILGVDPGLAYRFSAMSVCDSALMTYRRSDLDEIVDSDSELRRDIVSSLVVSAGRAQDHLLLLGRRTARERILAFLSGMSQRVSRSKTSNLHMQRSDIADFLGLSRETVSRTLTQLESDGIVEVKHSRQVSVKADWIP